MKRHGFGGRWNYLARWCFLDKRSSRRRWWDYVTTRVVGDIPAREIRLKAVRESLEAETGRLGLG
ncbi:hypothetical protein [Tautonia plasticadhaerens]|uniref:hypothetical protein n=1 Tax=Tautonia plasticadhaerens TaxID=2527974 RepID=UPI00119F8043|nr:hypothetical protein [Tautonia plasticadhaerens]